MIKITEVPYSSVRELSRRDQDYQHQPDKFSEFISFIPELNSFKSVIDHKSKQVIQRDLLVEILQKQYVDDVTTEPVKKNIQALGNENAFCVITAHQPSLLTGPLYYIYKIASTIHLSQTLQQHYPDYHFVPVFVSGGEDHDFIEVNHLKLFNQEITWDSQQTGAVGRFNTEELVPVLAQIKEKLGESDNALALKAKIDAAIAANPSYGKFVFRLVNALFGKYGLVIVNSDQEQFKRLLIPIFKDELLHQRSKELVQHVQERLETQGYKAKAHARDINLFYLSDGIRERIVLENGKYQVLNNDLQFTQEEMLEELEERPENFSPNVVLRPLCQEYLLPNLAYIGGGGEIAYWLERKQQFEYYKVPMPLLVRRNSVLWVDKKSVSSFQELGFKIEDIFLDEDKLINQFVASQAQSELSLKKELNQIAEIADSIVKKSKDIDPTLSKSFSAEKVKLIKSIQQMESRLKRAEKQKYEVRINRIRKIRNKLFPGNSLQERKDNFIPFFLKFGDEYLDYMVDNLDPLNKSFLVVSES